MSVLIIGVLGFPSPGAGAQPDGDYFLQVNKSIDLFGRVYKEVTSNYVDMIDPERFMQAGIEAMLTSLDPYTIYIGREEGDEVELLTSGKYGGIGVTIGHREGSIQVITVMDGYSAQRQGIIPGDRIVEVDGVEVRTRKPDEVRNLTRGVPGTEVKLLIEREGEPGPLTFVLVREEIKLRNVTFVNQVRPGIGYIRLERFSRGAGEDMRRAIKELKGQGNLRGLIMDTRGNPGGLLDAAVEVVSKFVPKGSTIVTTRGRRQDADKVYRSVEEPLVPDLPLVILTDRGSASASEIVSGALQDLDRALVVGDRTFGKGLVQTVLPLNFGSQLKITTARYYIPSGRSIQEIEYNGAGVDGVLALGPDSVKKEYRTSGGRIVQEHGGITPDSLVVPGDEGPMIEALKRKSMFFRFANYYAARYRDDLSSSVTPQVLAEFRAFLDEQGFEFQEAPEVQVAALRKTATELHYGDSVLAEIERLAKGLEQEKVRAFERYDDHIRHYLFLELNARLKGEKGRIEASLADDLQLETAIAILGDRSAYDRLIGHE
jgi:carboxyl-terminal processing protease